MALHSTRYDGEDVTLYRIDWPDDGGTPLHQRYNGVHASPVEYEGDVYLFVHTGENPDAVPFDTVRETLAGYDVIGDGAVEQLDEADIGSEELPEEAYRDIRSTVEDRGFAVQSLVETPSTDTVNTDNRREELAVPYDG